MATVVNNSNSQPRNSKPASRPGRTARFAFLTVGQTARILGISSSTLRLWESVGLVTPARSNGRYRLYRHDLLDVLKRIKYLRDVKRLNVLGIKQVLGDTLPPKPDSDQRPLADLAQKLRQLRKRRGFSVTDAARRSKISPGFLSAIELSNANPSVATLYRLAAAYGTTVLELYDFPSRSSRVVHPNRPSRISAEKVFQNAHLPRLSNRSIPTRLEVLRISIASAGQMIGITPNPILELQRQLGIRAQVVPVNGRHFGRGKSGAAQIHFSQLFNGSDRTT
jgi:DNA-binding transcriptional MerR regulator